MRAVTKTVVIGSLIGVFLLLGCDSPTAPGSSNPVAGTWTGTVSDSTLTMVFKGDSTFSSVLPNPAGTYYLSGTYSFTSTTITLNYASGLQGTEGIPPPWFTPVIGTLSGTRMTIPIPYNPNGDSTTLSKQK